MANYPRQKSRPPATVPPTEETTQPTTQDGQSTQSISFIRTMLEATMGTFLYLRYIFPDEYFEPIELRKEVLPPTDSTTSGSINDVGEETMIMDDSQIEASQQVSKPLIAKRVKKKSPAPEANEFLARLEAIIDAVSKEYLRSVILYVILDPNRPNQVLETVTFNFTYSEVGPSCILTREVDNLNLGGKKSQTSAALMTQEQVYQTMKAVLRDFVKEAQDLPDLPEKRCLNFKIFYTGDAPADYEVPGFAAASEDAGLVFGTHSRYEEPEGLTSHVLHINNSGLSVRLASIAGHIRPRTDIEGLAFGDPRPLGASEKAFKRHLEDAERRDVTWDAETSVINQDDHGAIALGREDEDGVLQPLPPSQMVSEIGSDGEYNSVRASGHGERATDLSIVPKLKAWGNSESYVGTQEVRMGIRARRSDSEETAVVPSGDETQSGPQSLQVTGTLSEYTKPNHSDHSSGSNPEAGLISSDEHTDPSSQEYSKDKDSFRAAALPPVKPIKPKKARTPSTTARSKLLPKPPKASRKPRAPADPAKKKPAKPRAKPQPRKSSSDEVTTSTGKAAVTVEKPPKTPKAAPRSKMPSTPVTSSSDSDKTAADDEPDLPISCGCGIDITGPLPDMIVCDGCQSWKHGVCMGLLRIETIDAPEFHCVMCQVAVTKPSQSILIDTQGDFHFLCLLRRILFMSRKNKVLPTTSELCSELRCSSADITTLLNRLVSEQFLTSEKIQKNAPAKYTYVDTTETKKAFSSYFRPGGRKERQEVSALEDLMQLPSSSQIPSSQVNESSFDNSQNPNTQSTVPDNQHQASQFQKQQLFLPHHSQLELSQAEDIEMEESSIQAEDIEMGESSTQPQSHQVQSPTPPKRRMAPIPETDPIETFNSTQPKSVGRGNLEMEIDDTIDTSLPPPTITSRKFDRVGKRKAGGDAISNRPTARIRAATGTTFIDCPFVEI